MLPFIYFLIPIALLGIAYLLNFHFKWLTKQNFYEIAGNSNNSDDAFNFGFGLNILLFIAAWPFILVVLAIIGTIITLPKIIHAIIPNENIEDNNSNSP